MGHIPNHRMVVAFFFYEKTNTKKRIKKINTMPLFLEGVFIFNKDRESFVLAFFFCLLDSKNKVLHFYYQNK